MLNELVDRLDATALAEGMRDSAWAVPLVQTIHILAIAVVFSASLLLLLRTFGLLGNDWSPAHWSQRLASWTWAGLIVLLLSGMLMVTGEPARSLLNVLFQAKMILVVVAALASWQLAISLRRAAAPIGVRVRPRSKLLAAAVFALWIAIISAGRWIAYYEG